MIIILKLLSELEKLELDLSDKIARRLTRLIKDYERYGSNAVNISELNSAKKELNGAISLVKLSIRSQKNINAFDTSNKQFLLKLNKYLNFHVKEALSLDTKSATHTIAILEEITRKIYLRDFKNAEIELDNFKIKSEDKMLFSEKIKNFIYDSEYLSIILSFGIIASLFLYISKKYDLFNSIDGLSLIRAIIGILLAHSVFGTFKKAIKFSLDNLFSLISEDISKKEVV